MNVTLFTKGTGGDLAPLLALGDAMASRGHKVSLLSHCVYRETAQRMGFSFVPLDDQEEFERSLADGPLLNDPRTIPEYYRRHCLPQLAREYDIIAGAVGGEDSVLISRHMATIADLLVRERLKVPLVRVFTAVAQVSTLRLLKGLIEARLAPYFERDLVRLGIPIPHNWDALLRAPVLNLASWPLWFAGIESDWMVEVNPIGFLNCDAVESGPLQPEIEELLNTTPAPVLISGGLGCFLGRDFYEPIIRGCALADKKAIVVTRFREDLPAKLSPGVHWVPYLPFADVMRRISAVIHHAGTSTIARAITSGTPQLLLPFGGDRPDTARRCVRLGASLLLLPPMRTAENVARALVRLLGSESMRNHAAQLAKKIARDDASATACRLIESVCGLRSEDQPKRYSHEKTKFAASTDNL